MVKINPPINKKPGHYDDLVKVKYSFAPILLQYSATLSNVQKQMLRHDTNSLSTGRH